jgi:hypothetical protein
MIRGYGNARAVAFRDELSVAVSPTPLISPLLLSLAPGILLPLPFLVTLFLVLSSGLQPLFTPCLGSLLLVHLAAWLRLLTQVFLWGGVSPSRFFLPLTTIEGRCPLLPLLKALTYGPVAGLVAIMLAMQIMLLFNAGITVSRVLSLIDRQRCASRGSTPFPSVPSPAMLLPLMAPVLTPAGRSIPMPAAEI